MNNSIRAEYTLVNEVIMPFLKEHWDVIDQPERGTNKKDGRLTQDELERSYHLALAEERPVDAWVIGEILERYVSICQSYEDGYWWKEEPMLGISEEDISVYEQKLDALSHGVTSVKLRPKHWM